MSSEEGNANAKFATQTVDVLTDIMSKCIVHVDGRTSASATVMAKGNGTMLTTDDSIVISLPLHLLYTVRLAPKQKIGLATVFSIGIIVILVAIARAVQISRKTFADGVLLALWGIIECTICEYKRYFKANCDRLNPGMDGDVSDADL